MQKKFLNKNIFVMFHSLITFKMLYVVISIYVFKDFIVTQQEFLDNILFHLKVDITGTVGLKGFFLKYFALIFIITCCISILVHLLNKYHNKLVKISLHLYNIFVFALFCFVIYKANIYQYVYNKFQYTDFIKNNYVKPLKENIVFTKNRHNLILVFLESMEANYSNIEINGIHQNLIKNLTKLAIDNETFSDNKNLLNSIYSPYGTNFTASGIFSVWAGIPTKVPVFDNPFMERFFNNTTTLLDILHDNGYYQESIRGSYKEFANYHILFSKHGGNAIFDLPMLKKEINVSKKNNNSPFGISDKYMFAYAKERLKTISKQNNYFNMVLVTLDTHFPNGYLDKACPKIYNSQYKNVVACSDSIISNFVSWCKKQDFYNNTTIVLVGDHPFMNIGNSELSSGNFDNRKVYFTIINPNLNKNYKDTSIRKLSKFDLFPTILASLGANIKGNKLGLGVNLYSNEKTLVEKIGIDALNEELKKQSKFYEDEFY